jgi:hypothetical protein
LEFLFQFIQGHSLREELDLRQTELGARDGFQLASIVSLVKENTVLLTVHLTPFGRVRSGYLEPMDEDTLRGNIIHEAVSIFLRERIQRRLRRNLYRSRVAEVRQAIDLRRQLLL